MLDREGVIGELPDPGPVGIHHENSLFAFPTVPGEEDFVAVVPTISEPLPQLVILELNSKVGAGNDL